VAGMWRDEKFIQYFVGKSLRIEGAWNNKEQIE